MEEAYINAIDAYLHGTRRPIADTTPADASGSSRAQLQALLAHLRRTNSASATPPGDEQTRRAEARRRDKALLIDWARNAGIILTDMPANHQINGPKDLGGSEHHVFEGERWLKITKGDGSSFGYQPLDEGKDDEWMISKEPADLLSYLEKLALHNHVFHDDIVLHGVVADPLGKVALIISQPDYQGTFAGVYTAIKPAMEAAGFVRVEPPSARKETPSAYYRPSDNVAVVDLHDQNAVLEDNGTFLRVFDNIMLQPTGALRATFERLAAQCTTLAASDRTIGPDYYAKIIQQKEITYTEPRIVWHQTGHQSAKAIRAGGFKSGSEVGLAEKRGGVYFADLDVNPQLYSRTAEGEAHAGQPPDAIPLNLQGLRLLNLSYEPTPKNWPLHKEFGAKMIRGEFDTLPEGVDGAIQFLDDGRIYEVALPPSTANRQRSVTPTADIATTGCS
jgi:hypothetical protein